MVNNIKLQSRLVFPISIALILLIPNLAFAQESQVTVTGYVLDSNGSPIENAWVSLHDPVNNIGAGNQTLIDGSYSILIPIGTYNLDVSPPDSSLSRFFKQNIAITGDMAYNIILVPRAEIVDPIVFPQNIAQGSTGNVQFSMITENGTPLAGLVNGAFEIWLHDWSDPNGSEWWNTRNQNLYHIDMTNSIIVSEIVGQLGNYQFDFILPDYFGSVNSWAEFQIIFGEYHGWAGFQVASATAVELSGWVTTMDGVGLADVGVGLWNPAAETGAWTNTDSTGFYSLLAEPGTYNFDAWPQSGDIGGFFQNGFTLSEDTVFNIILTPRAIFSEIELSPKSIRQGEIVSASFSITDENNVPLTGIPDSTYTIWLHNWQEDPSDNWWDNPISNQYHQDISDNVIVMEDGTGSYSFSFNIPSSMQVSGGWIDLDLRLGGSHGWAVIQVASSTAVMLSGVVTTIDGSGLVDVGVGLWNQDTETGAWSNTDSSGFFSLVAEPGTYNLNAWSQLEDLNGFFQPGFTLTEDTVFNIVLIPRVFLSEVEVSPKDARIVDTITATFSVTDKDELPISGIPDNTFNVWIHNWRADPNNNWWETHAQNQYHQDISENVNVIDETTGSYSFTFTIPSEMIVSEGRLDLEIRLGDSGGWASLQIVSGDAVELSGWVKTSDGTGLADAGVGVWNPDTESGSWSQTDISGFFSLFVEPGTYNLNAHTQSDELGGFFQPGFTITSDTVYNITLTPRAIFSEVELDPKNTHLGDTVSTSFTITNEDKNPLTDVPDSSFSVWLHNWGAEPSGQNWWKNHVSNEYHQDISEDANIIEGIAGSYSFSFTIPSIMNVTGGHISLEIRLGDSGGWAGIQVASATAVELSGWVKASNGTDLEDIGVGLFNPTSKIGAWSDTDPSGHYSVWIEPGTYMLYAGSKHGDLVGFFKPGFDLTSNTVYNITLNPQASFSEVLLEPMHIRVGEIISASFDLRDTDNAPLVGILNNSFTVWIHNWEEDTSDNWWENPVSNEYHQDISEVVNIIEDEAGSYSFSFTIPSSMEISGGNFDLEIRLGDSMGWASLHVASDTAVELSGRVSAIDGSGIADVEIGLWNPDTETGTWGITDDSGFFKLLVEPGTYHLNAWPRSENDKSDSGLSGFFNPSFSITSDTIYNIVLTPRAFIDKVQTDPQAGRPGDRITASFNITDEDKNPLSGLPDNTFNVWLHNWQDDPSDNWWENPISNEYHQDISDIVNIIENVAGSYSFTLTIPTNMDVTSGWLDLEIRLGDNGGWAGIQVASESSVVLSGIVVSEDGAIQPRTGVVLVDTVNNKEFFTETEPSGHYTLLVEPGVYTLLAKGDEALNGYKRIGLVITSDRTWDITLTQRLHMNIVEPFPEPFNVTETVTINLEVYDENESLVTGLLDSEFNIWIHNHDDPNDWQSNPIQNNYHQNMTNIITVIEISPGKYSLTFTLPDGIDTDTNMISLKIHITKYGGWITSAETGLPLNKI